MMIKKPDKPNKDLSQRDSDNKKESIVKRR